MTKSGDPEFDVKTKVSLPEMGMVELLRTSRARICNLFPRSVKVSRVLVVVRTKRIGKGERECSGQGRGNKGECEGVYVVQTPPTKAQKCHTTKKPY